MKKILTIILALLPVLAFSQIKYDSVRVVKPQNFVEAMSIDTAIVQIISQKAGANRRVNFQTVADWILAQQPNLDSAQYANDTLLLFYGPDTIMAVIPSGTIDTAYLSGDTLGIVFAGDTTEVVLVGLADGNGLFDASNNNDTIRVSTALLRAAFNLTGGAYGMNITSSSIPFAATSTGNVAGWFTSGNSGTTTYMNVLDVSRTTTGTAAAGLGGRIRYILEADNGGTTNAGYLGVKWTSAAFASPTSAFEVRLLDSGIEYTRLSLAGSGQLTLDGYANNALNNVDSSLYVLAVDATGDVHTRAASGLGGDGNGIISALPAGNVSISAASNNLTIDSLTNLNLTSRDGLLYLETLTPTNSGYSALGLYGDGAVQLYGQYNTKAVELRIEPVVMTADSLPEIGIGYQGRFYVSVDSIGPKVENQSRALSYRLTTTTPSATAGDTSVMVWVGGSNPFFLDKSDFGGGGISGATIDSVFVRNDSIHVSEDGIEFFTLKDPTGRNTSAPTSFGGDGTNIHFQPRVQLGLNNTWREEFPGIAYNPYTGRLVAVYRYADNHAYSTNGRGVAQYSDDFGKTWSDTVHFAVDRTAGEDKGVDPGIFYDQNTRLFLANATRREDANSTDELVIIYSSPDGATWTTYDTIPKPAGTKGYRAANSLQRLKDNRLVATGYTADGAGADSLKLWFFHSSDNGATWASVKVAQAANATANGPNEGQIIQKPDGTIYIYARHDTDTTLYRYASTNNGATWSAAVDVTPPSWYVAFGSKPSLHIFSDSILFSMYRKAGTTNGAAAYSISTDWGATWSAVSDMPQSDSAARWYYAAYTRIDDNGAFLIYSEGQNMGTTGATAPKVYVQYFSSGASTTGEQMQADVLQLREHTPGTLLEGATYYDGTSIRYQDASTSRAAQFNHYNSQTSTGSTTITLGETAYKYEKIDCDSVSIISASISGGLQGGNYKLHFLNANASLIALPSVVKNIAGTEIQTITVDSAALLDCVYDGTDFFCVATGATYNYSVFSFATISEAVDYIGTPYLEINAALETAYADEASADTLRDFSGNNRHFSAAGAARPVYDSLSTTSGLPAYKFSGSQYAVNTTKADWRVLHSNKSTVFIVAKPGNVADPNAAYCLYGSNGTSTTPNIVGASFFYDDRVSIPRDERVSHLVSLGVSTQTMIRNTSADGFASPNAYGAFTVLSECDLPVADSLDRSKVYYNLGTPAQNNTCVAGAGCNAFGTQSVANATYDLQIGAAGNNVAPLVGEISVMIVWDRILTPTELAILQAAYENEYGP